MSNIVYYGFKDSISIGPSPIKKPVIKEVEELKDIASAINNHIEELNTLLSPENKHFSFIFPNYTRPILADVSLTENFPFDPFKVSEIEPMLFIEQIEIFSSLSQNLQKTFLDKTKDLPEPFDSPGLWPTNQKVIDRTLELAHNIPKKVADTTESNKKKSITRSAFASFTNKLDTWKKGMSAFQSSYNRKFSEVLDKFDNLDTGLSRKVNEQNSLLNKLQGEYNGLIKLADLEETDSVAKQNILEQARQINNIIQTQKAVLNEIPTPAGVEVKNILENVRESQTKFLDLHNDASLRIRNFVEESFLSDKNASPVWVKKPSPVKETAKTKATEIINILSKEKSLNFGSGKQNVLPGETMYGYIGNLSDGLASVSSKNKWGFVNEKGEVVIPFIYDAVRDFSGGLAVFKLNDKWGFINTKGEQVVPMSYDHIGEFSNGLASVSAKRKCGFVNEKGEEVIELKYDSVWDFREGFAGVKLGDKWGHINQKGEVVVPLMYDYVWNFYEGLAWVRLNDKYGFVNTKGKEAISLIYDEAGNFSKGLAPVKLNGKYGFVNLEGKVVIPLQYDGVNSFDEKGLARVELNGGYTFIDQQGKLMASFQKIG